MAKAIAVANQKGGVAKTTTAAAVGAELKRRGFRTLVIDIDPQGNLSYSVGAEMYKQPTVYELLKGEAVPEDAIQNLESFDIIPANIMLAGAEQELTHTGKEHRLKECIEPAAGRYDYIIIDTPPSLGVLTVNAFTLADEIIIPTTAGIFAANGIRQLYNTALNVKKYCNSKIIIAGILLTRYNPRANISKEIKELTDRLGEYIQAPLYETFIRNSVIVEEAQANKVNIMAYKNGSAIAEDYAAFVSEYLKGE